VCANECLHGCCNVKLVCLANMHERDVCVQINVCTRAAIRSLRV